MHCYETIFIMHPDLGDEAVDAFKAKVAELIEKAGGRIYSRENWGRKRLAYQIRKQSRGNYQLIRFVAGGETVAELERMFRLDESCLKFLTIKLKTDPAKAGEDSGEGDKAEARDEAKSETKSEAKSEATDNEPATAAAE